MGITTDVSNITDRPQQMYIKLMFCYGTVTFLWTRYTITAQDDNTKVHAVGAEYPKAGTKWGFLLVNFKSVFL